MFDGWSDVAVDYCADDYGRPSGWRLILKLVILYLVLASLCRAEMHFRRDGIDLEANVELVGEAPKGRVNVRLHFRDPVTGLARINTVSVPRNLAPTGRTAPIQYIPGEYPTSRLKVQSRPWSITAFFWLSIVFVTSLVGLLGYIAIEANRPIPRSPARINGIRWRQKKSQRRSWFNLIPKVVRRHTDVVTMESHIEMPRNGSRVRNTSPLDCQPTSSPMVPPKVIR